MARPRDPSVEPRVMAAARALMAEGGYAAMTMEAVAHRAGVGKPTVYRRWPTRPHLAFELLNDAVGRDPVPDTGSLAGDLAANMTSMGRVMASFDRSVIGDIVGAVIADAEFAEHVAAERLLPDRDAAMELWHRAVGRGEVDGDVDGAMAIDDLVATCFWRVFVLHRHVDREQVASTVERVMRGVLPDVAQRTRAS